MSKITAHDSMDTTDKNFVDTADFSPLQNNFSKNSNEQL